MALRFSGRRWRWGIGGVVAGILVHIFRGFQEGWVGWDYGEPLRGEIATTLVTAGLLGCVAFGAGFARDRKDPPTFGS